jgi:hypothetical protein
MLAPQTRPTGPYNPLLVSGRGAQANFWVPRSVSQASRADRRRVVHGID